MNMQLIGQILTFISYAIFWISRFGKNKKNILIIDNCSRVFTIMSFVCLGSLNGIQNTIFSGIRNFIGQKVTDKYRYKVYIVMVTILTCMYAISFNGFSTVLLYMCAFFNLIGVILLKEQGLRMCGMIGGIIYIGFQIAINNYVGAVCEFVGVVVTLVAYMKCMKNVNIDVN